MRRWWVVLVVVGLVGSACDGEPAAPLSAVESSDVTAAPGSDSPMPSSGSSTSSVQSSSTAPNETVEPPGEDVGGDSGRAQRWLDAMAAIPVDEDVLRTPVAIADVRSALANVGLDPDPADSDAVSEALITLFERDGIGACLRESWPACADTGRPDGIDRMRTG